MPKIPQGVVDTAFYLYETRADAKSGRNPQGTGFLFSIPVQGGELAEWHVYGVANWHVAVQEDKAGCVRPAPVIRLNRQDGKVQVVNLSPKDWHFIEGGPDVAVAPLELDFDNYRVNMVSALFNFIATQDDIDARNIGVGEDVFMIGLFVDHGGIERNAPSARFGNISMLPSKDAPIEQQTGYMGECFILDMHSRTGFSGSPVFVYRTFGSDLTKSLAQQARVVATPSRMSRTPFQFSIEATDEDLFGGALFKFLGIHFGQFPEDYEIQSGKSVPEGRKRHLVREGDRVIGMSGMTTVIPAWEILRVLNLPELARMRDDKNERVKREREKRRNSIPKAEQAPSGR
jgi:hypothetical protein